MLKKSRLDAIQAGTAEPTNRERRELIYDDDVKSPVKLRPKNGRERQVAKRRRASIARESRRRNRPR